MTMANERLRWAVGFARRDLALCRAGDWLNLREELDGFIVGRIGEALDIPLTITPMVGPLVQDYTEVGFRELQQKVRELLNGAAVTQAGGVAARATGVATSTIATVNLLDGQRWAAVADASGRVLLSVTTSVSDGFLLKLSYLLLLAGANNVRRCPAPNCGQIFWRVKRQLYCSRTCSTRVNMRAFLDRKREDGTNRQQPADKGRARRAPSRSPRASVARKEGRS
jgi:hypothetical protein